MERSLSPKQYARLVALWHELGQLVAVEDNEDRAKAGYERYCEDSGGKSAFSDDPLIAWNDLPTDVQRHWVAAFTE
jgi:hypothetical protein